VLIDEGALEFYGGGNDLLNGQFLRGENGSDVLIGTDDGNFGALLNGYHGNDVIMADLRNYRLDGDAGNLVLNGSTDYSVSNNAWSIGAADWFCPNPLALGGQSPGAS
jgi:hypothetical protein